MADKSSIEWTEATLNAWTGCRQCSAGCAHCYLPTTPPFRIAGRKFVKGRTVHVDADGKPLDESESPVEYHLDRIDRMVRRKKPTVYFVNSLSDVFLEDVPWGVIAYLFAGLAASPQHTHQVLTKRPERMQELLSEDRFWDQVRVEAKAEGWSAQPCGPGTPLPNVWLGVTVENRAQVGRADLLRATPAAVRFLSCEPLLGPVVYDGWGQVAGENDAERRCVPCWSTGDPFGKPQLDLSGMDWVIAGGESGPGARPCREEWLRDLRDACVLYPEQPTLMPRRRPLYFLKQLGGHPDKRGGDKALLDGRLWHEMPPLRAPEPAQASLLA
jgi:protein gp37